MNEDYPFSEAEYKAIYSRVPRLCVDLVIKTPKGVVLTLRTLPSWHGLWHFPGGTVRYGESIVAAAQRVAKQELNIEIEVGETLGYMEFPSEEKEVGFGSTVSIALLCTTGATEFVHDAQASEVRTFTELPEHMLAEHKAFLETHPQWR